MMRSTALVAITFLLTMSCATALAVPPRDRRALPSRGGGSAGVKPRTPAGQATAARPASRRAKRSRRPAPAPVTFEHTSTHEQLMLRPARSGSFTRRDLRAMRHLLRCHHTGREHAMSPALVEMLYRAARHFHRDKIEVVAGYRAPRVAQAKGNPKSHHREGKACDFRVTGVALTRLRDYLRSTSDRIGVGYYPNSGFIHLDVARERSAYWIDDSGPGEPARYRTERSPTRPSERTAQAAAPDTAALGALSRHTPSAEDLDDDDDDLPRALPPPPAEPDSAATNRP